VTGGGAGATGDRINRAEVIVGSPGHNFVTLKLTTSEGLTGLGDATLNGRELPVASSLQDHLCPVLIGRDPGRIEDTWQYLYRGAYWRRVPVERGAARDSLLEEAGAVSRRSRAPGGPPPSG
jgi:L-alanine-DL-glutamate epimerase-like enolase superfamily enzyme